MDNNLCETLENFIPDDATCISVKINIPDYDASDNNFVPPAFGSINRYLKDCGVEILAVSSGIHLEGRREIPHLHYHYITKHYNEPSNPSQHRKRWLAKQGNETESFDEATFKYQRLESNKPKYQFLAYPLKEGRMLKSKYYIYNNEVMCSEMKNYLLSIGQAIYATQMGLKLRQEKSQERKQLALRELHDLCQANLSHFNTFREMLIWLDEKYISTLELEELPDPKNYKTNCQKVAVKLKLLKYSEI